MPRVTLTLAQKALLLVMLPLLFDIILLAALMSLVSGSEQLAAASERAREITAQAESLFEHLSEATLALSANRRTRNLLGFTQIKGQIETDLDRLSSLATLNHEESEKIGRVSTCAKQLTGLLEREHEREQNGGSFEFPLGYNLPKQQFIAMQVLLRQRIDLMDPPEKRKARLDAALASREIIKTAILTGVILNVFLATVVTVYINRGTARRLRMLMNKTLSLAKGEALGELIGGHDEIGELDVTFHEMARALMESAEKERAVVNYATDVICSFDAAGKCVAINRACQKFWGYEPDELLQKDILQMILATERVGFQEQIAAIKKGAESSEIDAFTVRKDGTRLETTWSLSWSEQLELMIAVIHDITLRKQAEQLKADFTAMVIHDVRSPLATVRMFFDLVLSGFYREPPQAEREQAVKVRRIVDRLLGLVNDILVFERQTGGEVPLNLEEFDFRIAVDDAVHAISGSATQVKVVTDVIMPAPYVIADAKEITRVISNLLSNATKFTPPGETIKVSVNADADTLRVEVEDRGPGVPDDQKALIFQKYLQARNNKKEGMGLGLAICQHIIERHRGQIGVKDAHPAGSIFWFQIPLHQRLEEDIPSDSPTEDTN